TSPSPTAGSPASARSTTPRPCAPPAWPESRSPPRRRRPDDLLRSAAWSGSSVSGAGCRILRVPPRASGAARRWTRPSRCRRPSYRSRPAGCAGDRPTENLSGQPGDEEIEHTGGELVGRRGLARVVQAVGGTVDLDEGRRYPGGA